MARPRPNLSISLPPGLDLRLNENPLPKTPLEQQEEPQSAVEPPSPPRQKYTVKRRRAEMVPFESMLLQDSDAAIPTIEMSESMSESSSPMLQPPPPNNGLLSPLPIFQRLVTPKTPCAQVNQIESPTHEWDLINDSRDNKRPTFQRSSSVCSSFSDSSISSTGSSGFSAPNGGCTSPESVATDPFLEDDMSKADKFVLSPDVSTDSPRAKRHKRSRDVKFTPEMDQHLESTYIRYLSDPRVTPFKTLPGVPPPLGVCNRVAVKARHTWSQYRNTTPSYLDTVIENEKSQREGSPDTIRPETAFKDSNKQRQWPRSDAATRKRLRKLVKGKPDLSAHYQRLLQTRSPSPFPSSSSTSRTSEPPSAFSSSEMKVSLITSTAPSMQPEGPLAQLAKDGEDVNRTPVPTRPQSQRAASRPANWFARIGRSQAHQKSLSLQSTLSLETDFTQGSASLASPFDEASNRSHLLHSMSTTKSLGRSEFNKSGKVPSLDSPFEVKGAPTMPRSLKRRFKSDEEKPRRRGLEGVFGRPPEDISVPRNRGFSVGAVGASEDHATTTDLPDNASPAASSLDHEMTEASPVPALSHLGPIGSRSAPRRLADPVPRLRSPFMETPAKNRLFNTFPRHFMPTVANPQPFEQRLRQLAAESQRKDG